MLEGRRYSGDSVLQSLEQVVLGAARDGFPDADVDPFDDLEDFPVRPPLRRKRGRRRAPDRDQLSLFGEILAPGAQNS